MADKELECAENRQPAALRMTKKRMSESAGFDVETDGELPGHNNPGRELKKHARFPSGNGAPAIHEQPSDSTQLTASLVSPGTGAEPMTDCFASIPADMVLSKSVDAAATLDDLIYYAPVNGIVNFPDFMERWTASIQQ